MMPMRLCNHRGYRFLYRLNAVGRFILVLLQILQKGKQITRQRIERILILMRVCSVGEIVDGFKERMDLFSRPVLKGSDTLHGSHKCLSDLIERSRIAVGVLCGIQHIDGKGKHIICHRVAAALIEVCVDSSNTVQNRLVLVRMHLPCERDHRFTD